MTIDERRRQARDDDYVRNMQKAYKPDLPLKLFLEEEARRQTSAWLATEQLLLCQLS